MTDALQTAAAPPPARSVTLGAIPGLAGTFSREFSVELCRRAIYIRAFERQVAAAKDRNEFVIPVYLGVGTEFIAATLSMVLPGVQIFAQHRCHGYYLAFGGKPEGLRDELRGLASGCAGGRAGSNAIHSPEISMFGHSGLMGEQVPIAVGAALASGRLTLTVCGDASVEEDYVYPALGWAASRRLPVLFICEDNGLSILTPTATRRSWSPVDVARGFGMEALDIADDPWLLAHHLQRLAPGLPAFVNIRTVRVLWHAGTGNDGPPEWDRYQLVRDEMAGLGYGTDFSEAEAAAAAWARALWA
jgi:acetoin:2,6-dichlorophenolindophenol oxidoreductase subunit alpha